MRSLTKHISVCLISTFLLAVVSHAEEPLLSTLKEAGNSHNRVEFNACIEKAKAVGATEQQVFVVTAVYGWYNDDLEAIHYALENADRFLQIQQFGEIFDYFHFDSKAAAMSWTQLNRADLAWLNRDMAAFKDSVTLAIYYNPEFKQAIDWLLQCQRRNQSQQSGAPQTELTADQRDALESAAFSMTSEEFEQYITKAHNAGAPDQAITEATMKFAWRNGDREMIQNILKDADQFLSGWKPEKSFLGSRDHSEAFLHAFRAREAFDAGDTKTFESEIREVIWDWPDQPSLMAYVAECRKQINMAEITVPFTLPLQSADGRTVTLEKLMEGKKALYLQFYASWCGPCMASMPGLKQRADALPAQGVAVAALDTWEFERSGGGDRDKALLVKKVKKMENVTWLLEPRDNLYGSMLHIHAVPTVVLISFDGHVLCNAGPDDDALPAALAKLGVQTEGLW